MCPYTAQHQRNLIVSHDKLSDSRVLLDVEPEFGTTVEELCGLMQSRGIGVKHMMEKFGSPAGLCSLLRTSFNEGLLDDDEGLNRRKHLFGSNVLPMRRPKSFGQLMLNALKEPTLVILEAAAVISLALSFWSIFRPGAQIGAGSHEWIEGVAIATGVLIIVLVSATNDYGKEQQFRALQNRVKEEHKVTVIRHGKVIPILTQNLLVGDICLLKYGDVVPADGVVVQSHELCLDESSLTGIAFVSHCRRLFQLGFPTGESDAVKKTVDADCQVFAGTHIIEGSGRFLVLAVGTNSETGRIYQMLGAVKSESVSPVIGNAKQPKNCSSRSSLDLPLDDPEALKKSADIERKMQNHSVFQVKLNKLAYKIGIYGFIFSSLTAIIIIIRFCVDNYGIQKNVWKNEDLETILDSIIVGITILVSAIPEGLPLAVTLTLAFSAKKMMHDNNLVRHLFACETMGCATTICSDKTGTLTTNRMTVTETWFGDGIQHPLPPVMSPSFSELLCTAIAVNSSYSSDVVESTSDGLPEQRGNKTECALLHFTHQLSWNYKEIRKHYHEDSFVKVYTFNSFRKSMSTVIRIDGGFRLFCKGAAETVLSRCSHLMTATGQLTPINVDKVHEITTEVISKMASNGLRTICVAYKDILLNQINAETTESNPDYDNEDAVTGNLTCLGIFGIEDPVRPEVPKAIKRCQGAGVCVRMITGDNIQTARSIALKCGIISWNDGHLVLDGNEFNRRIRNPYGEIDQSRMDEIWPKLRVLARSTPQDKYTLVSGIINSRVSKHREVVAVTGDGTNDAPALKKADIGFAMGIAGTDVAKEASDIILTDDNFASIVKACMWGRNIYDNVSKFLQFQLTVNVAALSTAIVSACVLGDSPLKAVPMLWVNMIQDTLGSLALATEPPGEALLQRKPYGRKQQIISRIMAKNILGQGLYQAVVLLVLLFYGPHWFDIHEKREVGHVAGEPSLIYTLIFNTLVVMTTFNLINSRCIHGEFNVFAGVFRNIYFVFLWLAMFITQVIVVEFGGYAFSARPLPLQMWMISIFFGVGSLLWYHVLRLISVKKK